MKSNAWHLRVSVDVSGICLGGGVVRNTAGSLGGRLRLQILYPAFIPSFDAFCPATDFIYADFSLCWDLDMIDTHLNFRSLFRYGLKGFTSRRF